MSAPENVYWDSCVFIRWLTKTEPFWHDIDRFIREAKRGDRKIYFSTIAFTEIRPRFLKSGGFGTISDLISDMGRALEPIDTNPNILTWAGELRDCDSVNPGSKKEEHQRVIGTPDAIHLMTCLYARDVLGLSDIVFHTLDEGKGKSWEGRCVPLIDFERWYPPATRVGRVADVISLKRIKPKHPQPDMLLGHNGQGDAHAGKGN